MRRHATRVVLGSAALLLAVGCNSGEQLKRVEQELSELKIEVFKLRQQVEDGNRKADADRAAATEARSQDRRFQADLQETLHQVQDSTRVLGNRLGSQSVRSAPAPAKSAAPEEPAANTSEDEKALGSAVLDYNRGNYALAAESLELFLKTHPSGARRPDALFFLGLCQYNQKAFDKAKGTFDEIIRSHAASAQFLPAKLKRAQSLLKLGLKPAAVQGFKELASGFRGTPEARTATQELEELGF